MLCYTDEPKFKFENVTLEECCDQMAAHDKGFLSPNQMTYYGDTNICELHVLATHYKYCDPNTVTAIREKYIPKPCNCDRVFKTVGRENVLDAYGVSPYSRAGGVWQSFPRRGECAPDQNIGDEGCTFKLLETTRAINATCLYELVDGAVYSYNETCFMGCPDPTNTTTDCYLNCYAQTTAQMNQYELTLPWSVAFNTCPKVTPPEEWQLSNRLIEHPENPSFDPAPTQVQVETVPLFLQNT